MILTKQRLMDINKRQHLCDIIEIGSCNSIGFNFNELKQENIKEFTHFSGPKWSRATCFSVAYL